MGPVVEIGAEPWPDSMVSAKALSLSSMERRNYAAPLINLSPYCMIAGVTGGIIRESA